MGLIPALRVFFDKMGYTEMALMMNTMPAIKNKLETPESGEGHQRREAPTKLDASFAST